MFILFTSPATAEVATFQQGANGYTRAQDTSIRWAYTTNFADTADFDDPHGGDPGAYELWSTNSGRATVMEVGQFFQSVLGTVQSGLMSPEAGPKYRYSRVFLRFRDVFGTGPGQVSSETAIQKATLKLYNTEDDGAKVSVGGAYLGDTVTVVGPGGVTTTEPNVVGQPKLNAGTIGIYPLLIPISYGFDNGTATKGRVTAKERRRGKQSWAQRSLGAFAPCGTTRDPLVPWNNDPVALAFNCGPADKGDPEIQPGQEEYDSSHLGAVESFQDASEGFKEFDVTGLIDFITGDGVFITALSPEDELPTLDINYGNAYRSSEFGDVYDQDGNLISGASAADIATRPMLVIEFGSYAIPGDANSDGIVDVADLGVVGANFGSVNAAAGDGDFNGDGQVDVADLGIVGANWTAAATGSTTTLVPEPTTIYLVILGGLGSLMRFRRISTGLH
ncbi:MAG: hypothetical protein CMJ20_05835 [Phycisphaeraceae bacterium]|nr:hypothetical protein [Phycisphaeraceae bacterium]